MQGNGRKVALLSRAAGPRPEIVGGPVGWPLSGFAAAGDALAERLRAEAQALRFDSAPGLRCSISLGTASEARRVHLTHPVRPVRTADERHQVFHYLGLARTLGAEEEPTPRLRVAPAAVASAERLLREAGVPDGSDIIALNPGSVYGTAKRWPAERFAAAGDALADRWEAQVVLVGSGPEEPVLERVARAMRRRAFVLGGRTDWAELAALLRRSRVLLTNDTGAMHIGAAVEAPIVAVFGPTD